MMKWLIDNWTLLVVLICAAVVVYIRFIKFSSLPDEEQIKQVKAFLLAIVVEAEKQFGSKTGKVKLSWTYSQFIKAFPNLAPVIPFELFSQWVDEVLETMRNLLSNNENLKSYVEGN